MLCVTFLTWDDICVARVGKSRVHDVWVMSANRECQAQARRKVFTTGRDYQHVRGALGDIEWHGWGVRLCVETLREDTWHRRYLEARGICQPTSGAFLCVLMQGEGYMYVGGLIYDLFEVPMCMASMEGASGSSSCACLGGAKGQSQEIVHEGKYSTKEGNFKHKSVIGACLRMANGITWKVWRLGRVMDFANIVAKK